MSDMVSVPAEKIAALREALETLEQSDIFTSKQIVDAVAAFRAVVDAVETEDAPDELTTLRKRIRALADEWEADWLAGETRDIVGELHAALGDA